MKRLISLYLIIFFAFLGSSLFLISLTSAILSTDSPLFPYDTPLSTRSFFLGMLLAAYPLGKAIGSPILGALSDKFGRKPLMCTSLLGVGSAYALVASHFYPFSLIWVALGLFCAGLFAGSLAIANSSLADTSEGEERTMRFSYSTMIASMGFIIGPALAFLFSYFDNPAIPFWILSGSYLGLSGWMFLTFDETLHSEKRLSAPMHRLLANSIKLLNDPNLRYVFGLNLIAYIGVFGFCRLYPQYLVNQFGIDQTMLCLSVINLDIPIILVTFFVLKKLLKKMSLTSLYKKSALAYAVGVGLFLLAPSFHWTWALIYPAAFGHAIITSVTTALVSHNADERTQGTALGNNTSLLVLSQLIAALMGMGLTQLHIKLPLIISGASLVLAYLLVSKSARSLQKE